MSPSLATAAPRTLGRYALHGKIAAGGMATVHFGRLVGAAGFSRTVAIKRLHPQLTDDPEFVSMFVDEARLAARIRHPNVVPTLDVVATDGELFLVLEYVHGETLGRVLRKLGARGESIPLPIVAAIFSGVLHGLHAAHEAKSERGEPLAIVHRDVSPQNIVLGVDGVARVLDFGVAKAAGRLQTTREGQLKGKLAYMAPEQLVAGQATRQTDVYAVAVCLWEALTGKRLFDAAMEGAVLHQILEAKTPPPSALAPAVPAALDAIVLRGLAADRSARFATAREMASAIEAALPVAVPAAVGEWIERVAAESLAQRAAVLAEIDRASYAVTVPGDADAVAHPDVPASPRARQETDATTLEKGPHAPWATHSQPRTQFSLSEAAPLERRPHARVRLVVGAIGLIAVALGAIAIAAVRTTSGANATTGAESASAASQASPSPPAPAPTQSLEPSPARDDRASLAASPTPDAGHAARPTAPARTNPTKRAPSPSPAPSKGGVIVFTNPG